MIYENKDKELQPVYETLSKLDTVPTKEKGFINYISQFCHVSEDIAKRLYNIMQFWKKRQLQETRDNRHSVSKSDILTITTIAVEQYSENNNRITLTA